jgi:glucose/arabinose dehydrogenase
VLDRASLLLVACLSTAFLTTAPARAQPPVRLVSLVSGLEAPTSITHAGDGRLFLTLQDGRVLIWDGQQLLPAPFLDISDRVASEGERGLFSIAFHPAYASNGYFFAYYTGFAGTVVISRFEVSADPDRALAGSEAKLLEISQPFGNHNGGQLQFGPDGYLYAAPGDGGGQNDPQCSAQDTSLLLGKMLRLDVDQNLGSAPFYGIPGDNPFVGPGNPRDEIWAIGLRNPWRFSFDPPTGQLWLADVGQGDYEEIDIIENGGNYGWDVMEGTHCFEPSSGCNMEGLILPVHEYDHDFGQSVTGGFVYRGARVPELTGQYIYADFVSGSIWAYDEATDSNVELIDTNLGISSFGVDEAQELYFTAFDGRIYHFTSATGSATGEADVPDAPATLHPNHPNPFAESTTITYTLDRAAPVELAVYDVQGRRVRTLAAGMQPSGTHTQQWDGRDAQGTRLADGLYVYRLLLGTAIVASRQMVLVR